MTHNLLIGWASRDVSTEKPVYIPGQFHLRTSKGILDPLTITALVVDSGKDSAIFLSADLVMISSDLLKLIHKKTAKLNAEIPVAKILLNATHTHTGASHFRTSAWGEKIASLIAPLGRILPIFDFAVIFSNEYRQFLAAQAAEAICEAWEKRSAGGISYGYGYATVGHSRRVVYFDDVSQHNSQQTSGFCINGKAKMYGDTSNEYFSHYEAGTDAFVNLLYTFDNNDKLTGAIVNVPAPAQNSEHRVMLSADYWHDTRVAIRKTFGDIFILPQCSAAGDLAPRLMHYKQAQKRRFALKYGEDALDKDLAERKDIAERLTSCFKEVYSWAKNDIQKDLPLAHTVKTIALSRRMISDDECETAKQNLDSPLKFIKKLLKSLMKKKSAQNNTFSTRLRATSTLIAQRMRFQSIVKRYKAQQRQPKTLMELHVLRIGDVAFASNRFELYMDYMHRIQARSPFVQTFVVQLCGTPDSGSGTYLATKKGEEGKGYSASLFCSLVSHIGGQELVDKTVQVLNNLHSEE